MVQTVLLLSCTVHRPSDSLPGLPCKRQACQLPLEMLLSGICGRGAAFHVTAVSKNETVFNARSQPVSSAAGPTG